MLRLLFVSFLLIQISSACSTPGYDVLFRGKCFKPIGTCGNAQLACHTSVRETCAEDEAYPAIFELEQDFAKFNQMFPDINFSVYNSIIGLTCNLANGTYTWLNGVQLTYFNHFFSGAPSPTPCTSAQSYFLLTQKVWLYSTFSTAPSQNYCNEPSFIDPFCGNYDRVAINNGDNATCIKVFQKSMNWTDAEGFCKARGSHLAVIHSKQVNDYIRRSALGHGFKSGIHIGLVNEFDGFEWTDGTPIDYYNFEQGYPNAIFGNCGTMSIALGNWVNVDCSSVSPFACTKPPLISAQISEQCVDTEYKNGDHLYSPGFPVTANTLCDYFLKAPAGKVVELEIVFLEANKCCDVLLLEDNTIGGKVIANLTGWMTEAKVYRSSSRYMWVHWQPDNGEGVRGFHGIFRTVSP